MSLPRYHDDPSPTRSGRVWRVWATLYDAVRRDPSLPLAVAKDLIFQSFFWEDDEMGYIPRMTVPIGAVLGIVRHAVKTNPKSIRPAMPSKFKHLVREGLNAPEKITGEKLDMEGESQILENSPIEMSSQHDSIETRLIKRSSELINRLPGSKGNRA